MRSWTYIALTLLGVALVLIAVMTVSRSASDYRLPPDPESQAQVPQPVAGPQKSALPPPRDFPPPPREESPFLNARADATYVGSQACAECHESEFASYRATTHSQALDDIHLDRAPPEGKFEHTVSGRNYTVYHQEGQLRHRESITTNSGERTLCDHPVRYVIGSGNHSHSYLVELMGFLVESPVTWYTARQAWEMSPGYENNPLQQGFSRPARFLCVNCHAGHVSTVGGSIQKLRIHEQAIGCERCHGPGSLHVERHTRNELALEGGDYTIVNPARLDRVRREAVCSQCHLAVEAHSHERGRTVADFRPGLRLTDFVVHYQLETPSRKMSVVGHVDQLHLSKCYQKSEMDCTTCHNPHVHTPAEKSVAAYRVKCLQCHEQQGCGLELDQRQSKNDNCVACHMPRGPTDIVHFAFTHHRIGIHRADEEAAEPELGKLVAINSIEQLPEVDRDRSIALAYVALAKSDPGQANSDVYHRRGLDMLYGLHQRGLRDPEVEAALAAGFWRKDQQRCIQHANAALACSPLSPMTRRDALWVLARAHFDLAVAAHSAGARTDQVQQDQQAVATLKQLAQLQLDAEDSALMGQSLERLGKLDEAIDAVTRATQIEPDRPDLREFLAQLHARRGDAKTAADLLQLAKQLREIRTRVLKQAPAGTAGRTH